MSGWMPPRIRLAQAAQRFDPLVAVLQSADALDHHKAVAIIRRAKGDGARIFFIGNGGSAAIASHMAADFLKNGGMAAQCFNDGALATCIGNDLGYEHVFAKPLAIHGRKDDVLVAISSSGRSRSITLAAETALNRQMQVITLSGFDRHNPLHTLGHVNFHVASNRYGVVEVAHHAICHAILDAVIDADR